MANISLFPNLTLVSAAVENNWPFRIPYVNITQNELPVKAQADASKAEVSPFDGQIVKTVSTDMQQIIKCSAGTSLISSKNFPSLPSPPVPFNGFEGCCVFRAVVASWSLEPPQGRGQQSSSWSWHQEDQHCSWVVLSITTLHGSLSKPVQLLHHNTNGAKMTATKE